MAYLQQSRMMATCDECRARFDPVSGGVCPNCRRLLCGTHYYGSIFRRVQAMLGMVPLCPRCRADPEAGRAAAEKAAAARAARAAGRSGRG